MSAAPEKTLQDQIDLLRRDLASLTEIVKGSELQPGRGLIQRTRVMEQVIRGDQDLGLSGQMKRIQTLEAAVEALQEERKQQRWLLVGIGIGLTLTSLGSIGTLITVLTQVIGVVP